MKQRVRKEISLVPLGYEEINSGAKYTFDKNDIELTLDKIEFSDFEGNGATQFPIVPNE